MKLGRKSTSFESKSELKRIVAEYAVDCICCMLCSAACFVVLEFLLEYKLLPFETIFDWVAEVASWLFVLCLYLFFISVSLLADIVIVEGGKICKWYRWKVVRFSLMLHWRSYSCLNEAMKRYEEATEVEDINSAV